MRAAAKSDINITPLIDIVLVLLIIFIVMVPSLLRVAPVVVPRQIDGPKSPIPPLVVTLANPGQLMLQQESMPPEQLRERLAEALQLQPWGARKVFLRVAPDLPHQHAIWALDQLRMASDLAQERTRLNHASEDGGKARVVMSVLKSS